MALLSYTKVLLSISVPVPITNVNPDVVPPTHYFVAAERRKITRRCLHTILQDPSRGGISAWAAEQLKLYFSEKVSKEKWPKLEDLIKSEPEVDEGLALLRKEKWKGETNPGDGEENEKLDTFAAHHSGGLEREKGVQMDEKGEKSGENVDENEGLLFWHRSIRFINKAIWTFYCCKQISNGIIPTIQCKGNVPLLAQDTHNMAH